MKKQKTLPLGTISHGTLIESEIIEAIFCEMQYVSMSRKDRSELNELYKDFEDDDSGEILSDIFDLCKMYTPEFTYLGAHEGDGSDIGVWIDFDSIEYAQSDKDLIKINSGDPRPIIPRNPPEHFENFLIEVNDHGNMTLFRRSGTKWIEVWSAV